MDANSWTIQCHGNPITWFRSFHAQRQADNRLFTGAQNTQNRKLWTRQRPTRNILGHDHHHKKIKPHSKQAVLHHNKKMDFIPKYISAHLNSQGKTSKYHLSLIACCSMVVFFFLRPIVHIFYLRKRRSTKRLWNFLDQGDHDTIICKKNESPIPTLPLKSQRFIWRTGTFLLLLCISSRGR